MTPWFAGAATVTPGKEAGLVRTLPTNTPTAGAMTSADRLRARGVNAISSWTAGQADAQYLEGLFSIAHDAAVNLPGGPDHGFQDRSIEDTLSSELSAWVATNSGSAWAPAVRLILGRQALARADYAAATNHFGVIWSQLKGLDDPVSVQIAREATSRLARLLAVTGHMEWLDELRADALPKVGGWPDWRWALELRTWTKNHPTSSYQCGLFCLDQLARLTTQPGQYVPHHVLMTETSTNGYTAADLITVGARAGLQIQAFMTTDWTNLPVPCVVHQNVQHYLAIRRREGMLYEAYDPVGYGVRMLTPVEVAADASGCILVNGTTFTGGGVMTPLAAAEAANYLGRCHGPLPYDHDDRPTCNNDSGGCPSCGGFGGGGFGGGGFAAASGPGMARWQVTEPYLNAWVIDTPLSYHPSIGPDVDVTVFLKSRYDESVVGQDYSQGACFGNLATSGIAWTSSLLSWAELDGVQDTADVMMPDGNWCTFNFVNASGTYYPTSSVAYLNNCWAQQVGTTSTGTPPTSLVVHLPNGSLYTYGVKDSSNVGGSPSFLVYFLSSVSDPAGNATTYSYDGNFNLTNVTAADGTTFALSYTNASYTNIITGVTASYGASVSFGYGVPVRYFSTILTNITDAAGLESQIAYDQPSDIVSLTNLATPYGSTGFYDSDGSDFGGDELDRYEQVTLPDGSVEFYGLINIYKGGDWPDYSAGQIPSGTPVGTLDSGTGESQQRNTVYWNAQQFVAAAADAPESFVWTDFINARIKHWLATFDGTYNHWGSLASQQDPSPDGGTTQGQITWYDYVGKPSGANNENGAQYLPSVIARVMPDTTTWYQDFTRETNGLPTQEIEEWGQGGGSLYRTNSWSYGTNGIDMVEHIGPLGEMVESNWFNANHEVVTNYDALGQMTVKTYNAAYQLATTSLPSGLLATNTYFSNHRLSGTSDSLGRTTSYTWNSDGTVATFTDELGMTVTNFWDGLHRLTGTSFPDGTTTTNLYTVGAAYPNSSGGTAILDLTATEDRLGNWTYYGYDARRRKIGVTNALGTATTYGYCICGVLTSVTNGAGTSLSEVTTYSYDDEPRLTEVTRADGSYQSFTLDLLGRRSILTDSMGSTTNTYDNLGRLAAVKNAFGQVEARTYDVDDNPTNRVDANGVSVGTAYDLLHRPVLRTYPDGGIEGFTYTAKGLLAYTNQLGNTTGYTLDAGLRKTAETNANNEVTKFTYDAASDLLTLTDPKTNVTTWHYDIYRRATNKVDATSTTIIGYRWASQARHKSEALLETFASRIVVDADNRLTNRWMTASGNTGYSYDPVGNLTNIAYPGQTVRFQYDALSRRTNMVDAVGTTTWTWLAGDLMGTETGPFSSDTITYAYNNRLRSSLILTQPTSSWTNQYTYDSSGRLSTLASPSGTFTYHYKGAGQLFTNLALPNTSYISNTFDSVARLTGTYLTASAGSVLNSHGYTYNTASQRTQQTRTDASTVAYTYDPLGQLKTAKGSGGESTENLGYVYDHAWNLNDLTNASTTYTFAVNSDNEMTSGRGSSFTYDGNGNLTIIAGSVTNGYDKENRLAGWTNGTTAATSFVYDGLGRLRKRQEYYWLGSGWETANLTNYVYDGNLVLQMRENSTPVETFTRGSDLSGSLQGAGGIGGLLARTTGYSSGSWSTHDYYHADGNGNITYLELTNQTVGATYVYDPYGNVLSSSGTAAAANLYRFSSKELHEASGMYYYGYRFYIPEYLRWVNRDPIQEKGGGNLYTFLKNQAGEMVDKLGLSTGDAYSSMDAAAQAAMTQICQLCKSDNREYGGTICQSAGGGPPYTYGTIVSGTKINPYPSSGNIVGTLNTGLSSCPPGYSTAGSFHCHGYNPNGRPDTFSANATYPDGSFGGDINIADANGYDSYLLNAQLNMQKYTPSPQAGKPGKTTNLGPCPCK